MELLGDGSLPDRGVEDMGSCGAVVGHDLAEGGEPELASAAEAVGEGSQGVAPAELVCVSGVRAAYREEPKAGGADAHALRPGLESVAGKGFDRQNAVTPAFGGVSAAVDFDGHGLVLARGFLLEDGQIVEPQGDGTLLGGAWVRDADLELYCQASAVISVVLVEPATEPDIRGLLESQLE